jgi:hypothetical protein
VLERDKHSPSNPKQPELATSALPPSLPAPTE